MFYNQTYLHLSGYNLVELLTFFTSFLFKYLFNLVFRLKEHHGNKQKTARRRRSLASQL